MARTNPPEHWRKRSLGLSLVSASRLRSYESVIREICNDLIDRVLDRGEMEFYREFATALPVRVVAEILGLPRADTELFVSWYGNSAPAAAAFIRPEVRRDQELRREEALDYMRAAIAERWRRPQADFLTELIMAQAARDGAPALEYLAHEADLLLFAGNVTTTHMLASTMLLMLDHPGQYAQLIADPGCIKGLIEESLRLESPVQWLTRYVTRTSRIGEVEVPEGSTVVVMWASGNRDQGQWGTDACEFSIDRPMIAKSNLAFGRGIHRCLGAPLARLEGRIAFEQLITRLPNLRLAPTDKERQHLPSILFRAPSELKIQFDPR
jgi:cytochrome P450